MFFFETEWLWGQVGQKSLSTSPITNKDTDIKKCINWHSTVFLWVCTRQIIMRKHKNNMTDNNCELFYFKVHCIKCEHPQKNSVEVLRKSLWMYWKEKKIMIPADTLGNAVKYSVMIQLFCFLETSYWFYSYF